MANFVITDKERFLKSLKRDFKGYEIELDFKNNQIVFKKGGKYFSLSACNLQALDKTKNL